MNFIELLNYLQPYFRSVRKIKQFFSIDLLFPQTWKFPNEILEKLNAVQDEKYIERALQIGLETLYVFSKIK